MVRSCPVGNVTCKCPGGDWFYTIMIPAVGIDYKSSVWSFCMFEIRYAYLGFPNIWSRDHLL